MDIPGANSSGADHPANPLPKNVRHSRHHTPAVLLALTAACLACTRTPERPRDTWAASADSVLSAHLTRQHFDNAPRATPDLGDCDTGGDNDTQLVAIARHRVLDHTAPSIDSVPDDGSGPARFVSFRLELTSVAHFIPTWTLGANAPHVDAPGGAPYVVQAGVRVDTVSIIIAQNLARPARWSVCDLRHEHDAYTPYWDFIRAPSADIAAVKWEPASASWATLTLLADSVAAATRR